MKYLAILAGGLLLLIKVCVALELDAMMKFAPQVPVTATPAPPPLAPTHGPPRALPLPAASPAERQAASDTRLYLSAFQSFNVSVIDPLSGHRLHEIPTNGDRAGVAIAPDGGRLYLVDGTQGEGQLRVFDTSTWQVIHQEPVAQPAMTFINPVALSGDGRWLLVRRYDYGSHRAWYSVFDTRWLAFLPDDVWQLPRCSDEVLLTGLVGDPSHTRLYTWCENGIVALDADTLAPLWQRPIPGGQHPDLALAPDGERLYALSPHTPDAYSYTKDTDLQLLAWETTQGQLVAEVKLSSQVTVPPATPGRGDAGYLAIAPDGARLYIAWEDHVWSLASESLQVTNKLKLPAPVDGMTLSVDGRELYLLPATSGDLRVRGHGLWTVDTTAFRLVRQASDWPEKPHFFAADLIAAPAPDWSCLGDKR